MEFPEAAFEVVGLRDPVSEDPSAAFGVQLLEEFVGPFRMFLGVRGGEVFDRTPDVLFFCCWLRAGVLYLRFVFGV